MSLLITRNAPAHLSERDRQADRIGVIAVTVYVLSLLVVAFWPSVVHAAATAVSGVAHAFAAASSLISNAPLDAAFVAIISAVAVTIGLGVHLRRTVEDREVFDLR